MDRPQLQPADRRVAAELVVGSARRFTADQTVGRGEWNQHTLDLPDHSDSSPRFAADRDCSARRLTADQTEGRGGGDQHAFVLADCIDSTRRVAAERDVLQPLGLRFAAESAVGLDRRFTADRTVARGEGDQHAPDLIANSDASQRSTAERDALLPADRRVAAELADGSARRFTADQSVGRGEGE